MSSESYLTKTNIFYKLVENTKPKGKDMVSLTGK